MYTSALCRLVMYVIFSMSPPGIMLSLTVSHSVLTGSEPE